MVAVGVHGLPLPGGGAHVLDAVLRLPAQLGAGLARVRVAGGDVPGPAAADDIGDGLAAGLLVGAQDLQDAVALAGAQIADKEAAARLQLPEGREVPF